MAEYGGLPLSEDAQSEFELSSFHLEYSQESQQSYLQTHHAFSWHSYSADYVRWPDYRNEPSYESNLLNHLPILEDRRLALSYSSFLTSNKEKNDCYILAVAAAAAAEANESVAVAAWIF